MKREEYVMKNPRRLKIYYDGGCRVCAREIAAYRKKDVHGVLEGIDIVAPGFDPRRHGRSREDFMARLHVRDRDGVFLTGVDAFVAIWEALPDARLSCLAQLVKLPGVHLAASLGYEMFARLRRWLPKNQRTCEDDRCHGDPPQG